MGRLGYTPNSPRKMFERVAKEWPVSCKTPTSRVFTAAGE